MGLATTEPPPGAAEAACKVLAALKSGVGFQTSGALSRKRARIYIAAPHPVFNLPLDKLESERPLDGVAMTGWRYLIVSSRAALATLELSASSRKGPTSFRRITDGPMAASVARALVIAEQSDEIQRGEFVLAMLRVPSLHAHALWFRDARAEDARDLFAWLEPSPFASEIGRLLSIDKFLAQIRGRRTAKRLSN